MRNLGDLAYRCLLLTFPPSLRLAHGDDMLDLFRHMRASEAGRPIAILHLWMRAIRDVLQEGLGARFRPSRVTSGQAPAGPSRPSPGRWQPLRDTRLAIRGLLRAPVPTFVAVVALGLGIGSNAAIFSVVYQVLVDPLPYPGAERVVFPWRQRDSQPGISLSPNMENVERWRQSQLIESMAVRTSTRFTLHASSGDASPELVDGLSIDTGFLDFTGTRVALGRPFTQGDVESDATATVALISDSLWARRFGRDPNILNQVLELNETRYTVVGVLPSSFRLPMGSADILVPLVARPVVAGSRPLAVQAMMRLKPGIDRAVAEGELSTLIDDGTKDSYAVQLRNTAEMSGDGMRSALMVLMTAVSCVLLIACTNVAHLLMARNVGRRQELTVRTALGATRTRLFLQLMTEHVALGVAGGIVGAVVAWLSIEGLASWRPADLTSLAHVTTDTMTYVYSLGLSVVAGIVVGVLPAWSAARSATTEGQTFGVRTTSDRRSRWVRRGLSVAEVAMALVLLCGAGLLIRSYQRLAVADLGFVPAGVIDLSVKLPARYDTPETKKAFFDALTESVRAIPEVDDAVVALMVPPKGGIYFSEMRLEGEAESQQVMFDGGGVQAGFIEALGVRVTEGRTFTSADIDADQPVVMVSEQTAARFWPGTSAVGQRLRMNTSDDWSTVIGVVGNVGGEDRSPTWAQIYMPFNTGDYANTPSVVIKTSDASAATMDAIRSRVQLLDDRVVVTSLETLDTLVSRANVRPRFNAILLGLLASIGLVLAVTGVYGVISYSVGLRTREFGVRVALGAAPSALGKSVLGEAATVGLIGVVCGLGLWMVAGRGLASLLVGLDSTDAGTLALVSGVILAATLLAAWLPARRAVRVDPVEALRAEA